MREDVVDAACVTRLVEDVGADATAGMIDRFLAMLPDRVSRLRRAVMAGEPPELRDAALSLGCSATMLGAHRLAAVCERCRSTEPQAARTVLGELEQLAGPTGRALLDVRPAVSARE